MQNNHEFEHSQQPPSPTSPLPMIVPSTTVPPAANDHIAAFTQPCSEMTTQTTSDLDLTPFKGPKDRQTAKQALEEVEDIIADHGPQFSGEPIQWKEIVDHCQQQFALDPAQFHDDICKTTYLLSICNSGPIGSWTTAYFNEGIHQIDTTGRTVENVFNWDRVLKAFDDYFRPRARPTAMAKLQNLRQTDTVRRYILKFQSLRVLSGITRGTHITFLFLAGLKDDVRLKVLEADASDLNSLPKLYAAAQKAEKALTLLTDDAAQQRELAYRVHYQTSV
ncbi:hypothetical protein QCA50_004323 [Cerrena zonata]|uniref:Retrotransposon gag domain-containing protein n=1 Tax=Cerrena zonata TaxID=2478898 RepID=A0AAW0GNM2_9APHY